MNTHKLKRQMENLKRRAIQAQKNSIAPANQYSFKKLISIRCAGLINNAVIVNPGKNNLNQNSSLVQVSIIQQNG